MAPRISDTSNPPAETDDDSFRIFSLQTGQGRRSSFMAGSINSVDDAFDQPPNFPDID